MKLLKSQVQLASPKCAVVESEQASSPPRKRSRLLNFMGTRKAEPLVTTNELEISDYLSEPCILENSDPLTFWRQNSSRFSSLAKVASKYLAMPASSAPVERLFSIAGKVFRADRCNLSVTRFQQLMLIRCNKNLHDTAGSC